MFWLRFVLILLTTTYQHLVTSSANTTTTITFYINNLIGQDNVTCQNRTNPCKTLHHAWQKMFEINATIESVTFSLTPSPAAYEPATDNNQASESSLFFNCGKNQVRSIYIQAAASDNVTMTPRYINMIKTSVNIDN